MAGDWENQGVSRCSAQGQHWHSSCWAPSHISTPVRNYLLSSSSPQSFQALFHSHSQSSPHSNQEPGLSPILGFSTRLPPAQANHLVWGTHHQVKISPVITQSLCFLGQRLPQGETEQMHYFVMPGAQGWDKSHSGSFGVAALHSHHPSLDTARCRLPTPGQRSGRTSGAVLCAHSLGRSIRDPSSPLAQLQHQTSGSAHCGEGKPKHKGK